MGEAKGERERKTIAICRLANKIKINGIPRLYNDSN